MICGEGRQLYTIIDHETIVHILSKYKGNFTDKVIDNYTNLMEELLLSDGIRDDKEFSKFIVMCESRISSICANRDLSLYESLLTHHGVRHQT